MKKKRFVINVFTMSFSMLIIKILSTSTGIYISGIAGATAMGIYHMIFSVFTFGITFSAAGTGFAVTRLISEGNYNEKSILKKALIVTFIPSFSAMAVFLGFGDVISNVFIKAPGATDAFCVLAVSLPCMGFSSVFRGYFIAKRKAGIVTLSALWEEGLCIATTLLFLKHFRDTNQVYMSLVYGCLVSNVGAIIFDSLCATILAKGIGSLQKPADFRSITRICIPIALGSYLRTALIATENLVIPSQFSKYGTPNPIGEYGIIKGMAMAVIMFPGVFVQGFSSMLVPELSEMNATAKRQTIGRIANLAISVVMMFGVFIGLMLISHHEIISKSFYKEPKVSHYLGYLSLLVVPMYIDTLADNLLKGLDMQNASLRYNIVDSVLRIISIFIFMPKFGPMFYVAMLYISEIFNLSLSLGKASKVCNLKVDWFGWVILPLGCAFAAYPLKNPIVQTLVYAGGYIILLKIKNKD